MALVSDFDSRTLRHALGRFATGVTIITTVDNHGQPVGLTAQGGARAQHAETWLVLFDLYRATGQQPRSSDACWH